MHATEAVTLGGSISRKQIKTGDAAQDMLLESAAHLRAAAEQGAERARQHRELATKCEADVIAIEGEIAQVEAALTRLRN